MLELERLHRELSAYGTTEWVDVVLNKCARRILDSAHGDLPRWKKTLSELPGNFHGPLRFCDGVITVRPNLGIEDCENVRQALFTLAPWRKGPFQIDDIFVDSEWRSNLKWERIRRSVSSLSGRRVLDVGCGNGYYMLAMLADGAKLAIGVDPSLLFAVQFHAITRFLEAPQAHVLPIRLDDMPANPPLFDSSFSMGVLYHQRNPTEHLGKLFTTLRPGGELIVETLIIPGNDTKILVPEQRYARMRNVWHLPTASQLCSWLDDTGFENIRIVDETPTTTNEQRTTQWMSFESLREALDPDDPRLTIEGLPAPLRAIAIANTPER